MTEKEILDRNVTDADIKKMLKRVYKPAVSHEATEDSQIINYMMYRKPVLGILTKLKRQGVITRILGGSPDDADGYNYASIRNIKLSNGIRMDVTYNNYYASRFRNRNSSDWSKHITRHDNGLPVTIELDIRNDLATDEVEALVNAANVSTSGCRYTLETLGKLEEDITRFSQLSTKHTKAYWVERLRGLTPDITAGVITPEDFFNKVMLDPLQYTDGITIPKSVSDEWGDTFSHNVFTKIRLLKELATEIVSGLVET